MGRTSDARDKLVRAARTKFHEESFEAVGVADLCREADVRKGSFYYFFDSKEALAVAALEAHWADLRSRWTSILGGQGKALDRLASLLDQLAQQHRSAKHACGATVGCLIGNLGAEQAAAHTPIRERVASVLEEQTLLVEAVLREAVDAGEVRVAEPPPVLAADVVALMQGSVLLAKVHDDASFLDGLGARLARRLAAVR